MLTDRTYMLFRPRSNYTNDRLNIRTESSSPSFGRLSHSSSFDRLNFASTTPTWTSTNAGSTTNLSYRKTDYLTPASPRLARRTMTFNSYDYRTPVVSSPNMEKREALMSSFARHTNTRSRALTGSSTSLYHGVSSSNIGPLPPRPKYSPFLANTRSNTAHHRLYTSTARNTHTYLHSNATSGISAMYDHLQEYFRPTIRQRPQFNAIRKSVMQRNRNAFDTNKSSSTSSDRVRSRLNGNTFGFSSTGSGSGSSSAILNGGLSSYRPSSSYTNSSVGNSDSCSRRGSLLSAGSSLSRSSSGSGCNLLHSNDLSSPMVNSIDDTSHTPTANANTTTGKHYSIDNGRQASGECTPIDLRARSVRKVYRYRSVIKFQEHNIGKSLEQRRQNINWDLNGTDDVDDIDLTSRSMTAASLDAHDLGSRSSDVKIWDVITDTTNQLAVSASGTALNELTENKSTIEPVEPLDPITLVEPNSLTKLSSIGESKRNSWPKLISQAVKPKRFASLPQFDSNEMAQQCAENDTGSEHSVKSVRDKVEGKVKQMIKTAGKAFAIKKSTKTVLIDPSIDTKGDTNQKKLPKKSNLKVHETKAIMPDSKGDYVHVPKPKSVKKLKLEHVHCESPMVESTFDCRHLVTRTASVHSVTCSSSLIRTDYVHVPMVIFTVHADQPQVCGHFCSPEQETYIQQCHLPMTKCDYFKFEPQVIHLQWQPQVGEYHCPPPIIHTVCVDQHMCKSEFTSPQELYNDVFTETFTVPVTPYTPPEVELVPKKSEKHLELPPHVHTSTKKWSVARTSYRAPSVRETRPMVKMQSLESQACELICSKGLDNKSVVTNKPPKSKKKQNKQDENKETEVVVPNDFVAQIAAKLAQEPEVDDANELPSQLKKCHSKLTNVPSIRTPLQEFNQQLNRNSVYTSNRVFDSKAKRIHFRKYSVDDFSLRSVLGRGSFGKVFLAELVGHELYFAIKCLKKNVVIEDNDVESTMIERKVLALGSANPFICKLFCTFQTASYLCFAMEYLAGGDLMFHVQKVGRFDENRARFYAAEIVCALNFLHRRFIIYRDLKLDNILLDRDGHIRLVDFGMCQCKTYRQECLPSNFCGTPDYMAPEIIKGIKYNHAVDWWSFGVLLYEMLIGKSPFSGADEDELLWNVCNESVTFPLFLSKESVQIITMLLNRNPERRLGMPNCPAGDVTVQPFFHGINWQQADNKQMRPPFVPDLKSADDISNFDKEFTEAEAALTPIGSDITSALDHNLFDGFSYTNPNMTD